MREKMKLERDWKKALIRIMEDLSRTDYKKFRNLLIKIPQSKISEDCVEMAKQIICSYGMKKSIKVVEDILNEIPRKDQAIQRNLRPFLEKVKSVSKHGREKGKNREALTQSESDSSASDTETDSTDSKQSETGEKCGRLENVTSNGTVKPNFQSWRQTIQDLKSDLSNNKAITGKVVGKSKLIPYGKGKVLFYMVLVDETDCIKLMGYNRDDYTTIEEGNTYMFRDYIYRDGMVRVTSFTVTSMVNPFRVPEHLMDRARELFMPAVCSIAKAKTLPISTVTSVEGTIMEMIPREVMVKDDPTPQNIVTLKDEEESVKVCLWPNLAKHCSLSIGNKVKFTNVKLNHYMDEISLTSTQITRIDLIENAALHNTNLLMVSLHKLDIENTTVECVINKQMQTCTVKSEHLAGKLGLVLDDNFKTMLLDKMPLNVDANIQGNKIRDILKVYN